MSKPEDPKLRTVFTLGLEHEQLIYSYRRSRGLERGGETGRLASALCRVDVCRVAQAAASLAGVVCSQEQCPIHWHKPVHHAFFSLCWLHHSISESDFNRVKLSQKVKPRK